MDESESHARSGVFPGNDRLQPSPSAFPIHHYPCGARRQRVHHSNNNDQHEERHPNETAVGVILDDSIAATEQIKASGGTPLYESCLEMLPLIDSVKDKRRAMLLLSDGEPNTQTQRDACHSAAVAAQIPVFTVGLGPVAEGDPRALPSAVKVLRELSTETRGGYASANDPAQLDQLFRTWAPRSRTEAAARPRAYVVARGSHPARRSPGR